MSVPTTADAVIELAAAVDRQTEYLKSRDKQAREDWETVEDRIAQRRAEDIERREREREVDWERSLMLRGIDESLASTISRAFRPKRTGEGE